MSSLTLAVISSNSRNQHDSIARPSFFEVLTLAHQQNKTAKVLVEEKMNSFLWAKTNSYKT